MSAIDVAPVPVDELRENHSRKWTAFEPDVVPAWIADMDFYPPQEVVEAVQRVADSGVYGYSNIPGELPARFAEFTDRRFGWNISAEHVVPVIDLVQAVTATLLALSAPGSGVVLCTPSYPPLIAAIEATKRRMVDVRLPDGAAGDAETLAELDRAFASPDVGVFIFCNPHNPTGRVYDETFLRDLSALAVKHDVIVISDEVHCDIVHDGASFNPMARLDLAETPKIISLHSATKSFNLGGLRCGVMHFNSPELLQQFFDVIPPKLLGTVSNVGAAATIAAWGSDDEWLASVLEKLSAQRAVVSAWAAKHPALRATVPSGTYFSWLDFSAYGLETTASQFLHDEARVALNPGETFGTGLEPFARLNFATSTENLQEILDRISAALERWSARGL